MKAEHRKSWLWETNGEKYPDTKAWDKLVSIMQVAFREEYITEAMTWTTVVLIVKGSGGYREIWLVEVIWKVCTLIVNSQPQISIVLHDALNGFQQGKGKGRQSWRKNWNNKSRG